jgi:hypothetical protein
MKSYLYTYEGIIRNIERGKNMMNGIIRLLVGIVIIVILIWIILAVVHAF